MLARQTRSYRERAEHHMNLVSEIEEDSQAPKSCKKTAATIREALAGESNGKRALVCLETSDPEDILAAVAIGDMDTADTLTWVVPGINTNVPDSLASWTDVAQSIYDMQNKALKDLEIDDAALAVLAWIGYQTPSVAGVWTVEPGRIGGERLADDIDTFRSLRGSEPHVNILGHSYGTNTVSYSLTKVQQPVSTAVLLGSSGINREDIPVADDLRVCTDKDGRREVWVSTAERDKIAQGSSHAATVGSTLLALVPFAGSEVTHGVRFGDPRGDWLGAKVFCADGGPDPVSGEELAATTTHYMLNGSSGYVDPGTQCARSVALITTKNGELVPVSVGKRTATGNAIPE